MTTQLERLAAALRRHHLDAALLVTPPNVTYASGWEAPLPGGFGTEIVDWLPAFAVVRADGGGTLCVPEDDLPGARAESWLEVAGFESLHHFERSDPHGSWLAAVGAALAGVETLGAEPVAPHTALDGVRVADATGALREARAIKTPRELERLRAAAAAADAAQRRLLELAADAGGTSEVALYAEAVAAAQRAAGASVAVFATLATGARSALLTSGGAGGRTVEAGDVGLLDLGVRVGGYWSDTANTVVFGRRPSATTRRYLDAARAACEAAIARLRPGARCSEPVAAIAETLERHGLRLAHYGGHQLGASINEPPRLLPYAEEAIEEGMVFAVEAGAYEGEGGTVGARCEKVALVTAQGPELLSGFAWG